VIFSQREHSLMLVMMIDRNTQCSIFCSAVLSLATKFDLFALCTSAVERWLVVPGSKYRSSFPRT